MKPNSYISACGKEQGSRSYVIRHNPKHTSELCLSNTTNNNNIDYNI